MRGRVRWAGGGRAASQAVLVALALVVLLPGCWLQIGAGPGHTRYQPFDGGLTAANVDTLHELWSVEVPGSVSEPMVSDGRVVVTSTATYSASVRALDAATGAPLWTTGLVNVPAVSGAAVAGTPVTFVGGRVSTGFFGFVPMAPGRPVPGPACTFGSVTLDPATGASSPGASAYPSAAASAGPVAARVLISGPTQPCAPAQATTTLEVTGSPGGGWTAPVSGQVFGGLAPTLTGDRVLLAHGTSLDAHAIDGCTADCLRWSRTLPSEPAGVAVDGTGPIFVRTGGALLALDQADGATLWEAPLRGSLGRSVAVANGTVYVASVDASGGGGVLQAFDAAGCGTGTSPCAPEWEAPFDGSAVGEPIVGGGVVYVADGDSVVAFDATGCGDATCSPLADVPVPGTTGAGRLALADGRLYVAGDGRLTALAPE